MVDLGRDSKKKNYGIFQTSSDPSQPGNFRPEVWQKTKSKKTLKNDPLVMKEILYDMGKKNIFFNYIFPILEGECQEGGREGRGSIIGEKTSWVKMTF